MPPSPSPFVRAYLPQLLPNRDMTCFPAWAHPEVRYWAPTWLKIRDCMLGEQEIKDKGETYLARLAEMDQDEYETYKDRGVFYNMTARTVEALVGTLFQRAPKVDNLPKRLVDRFQKIAYNGVSMESMIAEAAEAVISMGRYGFLVDMDASGAYDPYLRGYDTENILDWQFEEVEGRMQATQIVLREFVERADRKIGEPRAYQVIHRVLKLEMEWNGEKLAPIYRQYIYTGVSIADDLTAMTPEVVTPTIRGVPLDHIPFQFIGAKANTPNVDRPPCADISALNLAHYKAYAQLEHGRFYCAMPIYYVMVNQNMERAEYTLGPSRVWEVGQGEKPGILEFHGTGLKTLENSCEQKENQIAAIGGRLLGGGANGGTPGGSESDNQAKIKESNERALLLKVVRNLNEGLSTACNWWARWCDEPNPKIEIDVNSGMLSDTLGARELRAAHQMFMDGVLPITALHLYLQKAEVVPEWMDVEQFKGLMNDMSEFPNNADVWARRLGYGDAANMQDVLLAKQGLRIQKDSVGIDQQAQDTNHLDTTETLKLNKDRLALDKKTAASRPLPGQVAAGRQAPKQPPAK